MRRHAAQFTGRATIALPLFSLGDANTYAKPNADADADTRAITQPAARMEI